MLCGDVILLKGEFCKKVFYAILLYEQAKQ